VAVAVIQAELVNLVAQQLQLLLLPMELFPQQEQQVMVVTPLATVVQALAGTQAVLRADLLEWAVLDSLMAVLVVHSAAPMEALAVVELVDIQPMMQVAVAVDTQVVRVRRVMATAVELAPTTVVAHKLMKQVFNQATALLR
jgi:hypothetical protein